MKSFASDNNSGIHPEVLAAIGEANQGYCSAYGNDLWTQEARELFKQEFGPDAKAHFVVSGTGANIMGLRSILRPYECVVCPASSHMNTDECGALEAVTGCKLLLLPSGDGKITPDMLPPFMEMRGNYHNTYPKVVSIAQLSEFGTAYSVEEVRALAAYCKQNGWYLHMDGARLANAAARLNVSLKEMTEGVDLLSFGGAKNGLMCAEAVVFLNPQLGEGFGYMQKQGMQLGSKIRFLSAQFIAYLKNGLWLANAKKANAMTDLLLENLQGLSHVRIVHAVGGNAIFARMPKEAIDRLSQNFYFYVIDPFDAPGYPSGWQMVRFMTSFATTEAEVTEFAEAIKASMD